MNLVWFLTVAAIFSTILGEFGHYPFGGGSLTVNLTDILLFLAVSFLLIWQVGIDKKFILPGVFKIMIAFWAVAAFSLFLSGEFSGSLYLVRFIFYSLSFWLGFSLKDQFGLTLKRIGFKIILASLMLAILGFLQLLFFPNLSSLTDFGYDPHKNRLVSTFLDPNLLGSFLNIALLLSLDFWFKEKKLFLKIANAILFLAIILTFSRSAYLMLLTGILIYGMFKAKKIIIAGSIVFVLFYLVFPPFQIRINGALSVDKSASERFLSWQNGISIARINPVTGIGFNNIRSYLSKYNLIKVYSEGGGHAGSGFDSSLLVVLVTTGIIGLIFYLSFWFSLIKDQKKSILVISMTSGLFINSQFINSLFFPPIMLIVFLILGVSYGDTTGGRK